jgi:catechol 2,3-dioxygenase-like lactoylglutathione lyase family enzyme
MTQANTPPAQAAENKTRLPNPTKLFPLVLTTRIEETKRYYTEKAGFRIVYDLPTYLQMALGEGDAPELCFMNPEGFPDGVARPAFAGKGLIVSIPTPDADAKYADLKQKGAELLSVPENKPWGWRSFFAVDPNGVVLDFFHVESLPVMKDPS